MDVALRPCVFAPPTARVELVVAGAHGGASERRVPLARGARFVVDTQRLWHVVVHNGDAPRYALITSFESGPVLEDFPEDAPAAAAAAVRTAAPPRRLPTPTPR